MSGSLEPVAENMELVIRGDPPVINTNGEEEDKDTWRSCCIEMDKPAVVYLTTFSLISGISFFCCYQLTHLTGCSDQQAYLGILGMILGTLLPSPVMNNNKK